MGRLSGLDALRGVAATCVFITHLHGYYPEVFRLDTAYLAVDFFFMLSGFVMARSYGKNPGAPFLLARFKRLWPISALGVALCLPFGMPDDARSWAVLLFNLALLPAPFHAILFPTNPPLWSIFFELIANAAHTVVQRPIYVWTFCAGFLIFRAWIAGDIDVGVIYEDGWIAFVRVGASYFAGVAIYQKWGDVPPMKIAPVLTFAFIPAYIVATSIHQAWWTDLLFVALCPLVIWGGLQWHPAWGRIVGQISFPLYALHMPLLAYAKWAGAGSLVATAFVFTVLMAPIVFTRTRQRLRTARKRDCSENQKAFRP